MHDAGTAGNNANRAVAQELLGVIDWGTLAVPLIRAVQNVVQSSASLKGESVAVTANDCFGRYYFSFSSLEQQHYYLCNRKEGVLEVKPLISAVPSIKQALASLP